jgi:hypothetical protein
MKLLIVYLMDFSCIMEPESVDRQKIITIKLLLK